MFPRSVISAMASDANQAVAKTLLAGAASMISAPRTEIGFVAAVTLGAIQDIAAKWKSHCSGQNLSLDLTGVFCHGAPMVIYTGSQGKKRCELADLLVVVDLTVAGNFTRRAALIQAKMARAASRVSLSGHSSATQLDLYQNWYLFDFEEAIYGMKAVDFKNGSDALASCTYGVIDRHLRAPASTPPLWTQHPVTPTPAVIASNSNELGTFIAEMVDGTQSGIGRLATPSLQNDWSRAVEKLMQITYDKTFHHKATLGTASARRGVKAFACLNYKTMPQAMLSLWSAIQGPPFDGVEVSEVDEPSGISILHLRLEDIKTDPA